MHKSSNYELWFYLQEKLENETKRLEFAISEKEAAKKITNMQQIQIGQLEERNTELQQAKESIEKLSIEKAEEIETLGQQYKEKADSYDKTILSLKDERTSLKIALEQTKEDFKIEEEKIAKLQASNATLTTDLKISEVSFYLLVFSQVVRYKWSEPP